MHDESTRSPNLELPSTPSTPRRSLTVSLLVAAAFVVVGVLELELVRATGATDAALLEWLLLPWAPLGIVVSAMLINGSARCWPGAAVGSFALSSFIHLPPAMKFTQAFGLALCATGIFALLRRWRFNPGIERWQDSPLLWGASAIGAIGLAAIATGGLFLSAWIDPMLIQGNYRHVVFDATGHITVSPQLIELAGRWCLNWTTGVALLVPCVYGLARARIQQFTSRAIEALILLAVTVLWSGCALAQLPWFFRLPLAAVGLLLVTWPAIRFGPTLTSLITLILAFVTSAAYMFGRSPLGDRSGETLVNSWTFIIMVAVLGLLITSLLAERNAAARLSNASEARYRRLFESNPQPMWVQDRVNQRILMVNQAAIARYGYSREEFTQLSLRDLEAPEQRQRSAHESRDLTPDGSEYLHATHTGEQISVELWTHPVEFEDREAELVFSQDVTDRNRLRSALLDSTDRVERELSRELHDGLGPDLAALSLFARALRTQVDGGQLPSYDTLETIERVAQRAVATCRGIAHGLSALGETGGSLEQALLGFPQRFQHEGPPALTVEITGDCSDALPAATQQHILRVAQEAVANALKHARARNVEVMLDCSPSAVSLCVRDDGIGLGPVAALRVGLGRASMRYRASAVGGALYVRSLSTGGTEVRLECARRAPSDLHAGNTFRS
jgi:PAS domain S-box-containing protein